MAAVVAAAAVVAQARLCRLLFQKTTFLRVMKCRFETPPSEELCTGVVVVCCRRGMKWMEGGNCTLSPMGRKKGRRQVMLGVGRERGEAETGYSPLLPIPFLCTSSDVKRTNHPLLHHRIARMFL